MMAYASAMDNIPVFVLEYAEKFKAAKQSEAYGGKYLYGRRHNFVSMYSN